MDRSVGHQAAVAVQDKEAKELASRGSGAKDDDGLRVRDEAACRLRRWAPVAAPGAFLCSLRGEVSKAS
jgi:hypothetical protein